MKIIVFSDIHHGSYNGGMVRGVQRKLTQYAIPLTEKLIDKINEVKPDIVINLGDLIDDEKDHDKDIIYLKEIWKILQRINSPFYSVVGNHDIQTIDRFEVAQVMGYKNPTFSIDLNNYHFVFLGITSNTVKNTDGSTNKIRTICESDLDWLKQDINKNFLPSLVFLHHGIAEDDMKGNWWFENNNEGALLYNRNELKKILKTDKNLLAVFSGHQHWTKKIVENGIPYYLVGSLTENINGDGKPDGIWLEIELVDKKIIATQHHIKL